MGNGLFNIILMNVIMKFKFIRRHIKNDGQWANVKTPTVLYLDCSQLRIDNQQ